MTEYQQLLQELNIIAVTIEQRAIGLQLQNVIERLKSFEPSTEPLVCYKPPAITEHSGEGKAIESSKPTIELPKTKKN